MSSNRVNLYKNVHACIVITKSKCSYSRGHVYMYLCDNCSLILISMNAHIECIHDYDIEHACTSQTCAIESEMCMPCHAELL